MSDCRKCAEFDWCVENEDCGLLKPKPTTNYDRIRAMTDEELAKWIAGGVLNLTGGSLEMATEAWLDWLKQEIKE